MADGIFNQDGIDRQAFDRLMRRPAPPVRYVIHFTPRSGSSWLTDLAAASGVLGAPVECFNREFMPEMVRALGARSMGDYVEAIGRRFQGTGAAGFEITQYQMQWAFGSDEAFHSYFANARPIWLFREDIVAAAVSLQKMQAVGVDHSVSTSPQARASADGLWAYDGAAISEWLDHIRVMELKTLDYFVRFDVSPLVLSHETMMAAGGPRVLACLCRHLGLGEQEFDATQSPHQKVGTDRNTEFSAKFRRENKRLCRRLDGSRSGLIASVAEI